MFCNRIVIFVIEPNRRTGIRFVIDRSFWVPHLGLCKLRLNNFLFLSSTAPTYRRLFLLNPNLFFLIILQNGFPSARYALTHPSRCQACLLIPLNSSCSAPLGSSGHRPQGLRLAPASAPCSGCLFLFHNQESQHPPSQ